MHANELVYSTKTTSVTFEWTRVGTQKGNRLNYILVCINVIYLEKQILECISNNVKITIPSIFTFEINIQSDLFVVFCFLLFIFFRLENQQLMLDSLVFWPISWRETLLNWPALPVVLQLWHTMLMWVFWKC